MAEAAPVSIYLDWNATTPPLPAALEAMAEAARTAWANPSSIHTAGRQARAIIETAREELALALGFHPRDVLFTSGGTEANNLALRDAKALVTSRLEHPSVTRVAELLDAQGVPVRWVPVPESGILEPEAVESALVTLPLGATVAVMAVNHETGAIQPISAIAERVHRHGGRLHVDAIQAFGRLAPEHWAGADTVAVASHKIRGPKGIGALGMRAGIIPRPVLVGGAQERGLRPGTQDAVLAAGFRTAIAYAGRGPERYARLGPFRDQLESALSAFGVVNGGVSARVPHVTNLSFSEWRGDELVAALDLMGICVASGSACSAGTAEASPIISAMVGPARARSAVRISLGELTDAAEVEQAISAFRRVLCR